METFARLESEVRSYCRSFPTVFSRASGSVILDHRGRHYLDFFSGAGALNYGHNNPHLKRRLVDYLSADGICHGLDMATSPKRDFLERLEEVVLLPRGLDYKVQFPGPTGTNAVEAALKLARKVTGRQTVVYFANAFHGMTLGSLAVTSNLSKRAGAGVPLYHSMPMPYDGDLKPGVDTLDVFEAFLDNPGRGVELPAAVIVEVIQAEGGVRAASHGWLQRLQLLCRAHAVLLIVDDIQVGCGRTGPFFSFEPADLRPDLVCLSKSLSGYGLPLSVLLLKPHLDVWKPGEHNGTFRGHNLAFVTAAAALETYWRDGALESSVKSKGRWLRGRLRSILGRYPEARLEVLGRGLIQGVKFDQQGVAGRIARRAFDHGLIIETAGPDDEVLKLLPPLVIEQAELERGLGIIEESLDEVFERPDAPQGDDRLAVARSSGSATV